MKKSALRILQKCGAFAFARRASARMPRILMYHNFSEDAGNQPDAVTVAAARAQLQTLQRNFNVVSLSHALNRLSTGTADDYTLALTIDDGRRNFYEFFYPLLKEFKMPATFYVVSSFIERQDWIWTDKVLWLAEQPLAAKPLLPNHIDRFFEQLNRMRPENRNNRILSLAEKMNVLIPYAPPSKYSPCTWGELREMVSSGLVEVGSHTDSHPILSTLTAEESWYELTHSRITIETKLGRTVKSFCFPNGKPSDYSSFHVQQLRDAGYENAVVTSLGLVSAETECYELPRIGVSGQTDLLSFTKYIDGAEHYQSKIARCFSSRT